jgi:hypothetical protein
VGCVPVDECIIQLEFQYEIPQAVLNSLTRFIGTICAGRKDAQSIGGASIHFADVAGWVDERWRKGVRNFVETPTRRVAVRALSGFGLVYEAEITED